MPPASARGSRFVAVTSQGLLLGPVQQPLRIGEQRLVAEVAGHLLYVAGGAHFGRWYGKEAFVDGSTGSPEGGRMAITRGKVLSVNVGLPRAFEYNGRPARSAIWKSPVAGRVAARGVNLAGDDQADRRAHGGPDKAVYAYAVEDLGWWAQEIGRPLQLGEL